MTETLTPEKEGRAGASHLALREGTASTDVNELNKHVNKEPSDEEELTAKRKQTRVK